LVELTERDALLASLKPVKRGHRQTGLSGELSKRQLPALPTKKLTELLVQAALHKTSFVKSSFRLRKM
jgi:hypothetical protein